MPRPTWSGQVQISLVSFGVQLFPATEAAGDIHFHQIDRRTGQRVRHQKVLASALDASPDEAADQSDVVARSEIVKGYEYAKGQYITIEPDELAHLRVPSKHTLEVTQFVDAASIDPAYFEKPYFVVPINDAKHGDQTEAYLTVRQALADTGKLALTRIAFAGREHLLALAPSGTDAHPGLTAYTLRYAAELRNAADYFRDIRQHAISPDSLALAKQLIQSRSAPFDPAKFTDGYEAAVRELVDAKLQHAPVPRDEAPAPQRGKVINLMDALRRSVASGSTATAPPVAKPTHTPAAKKGPTLVKSTPKKSTPTKHQSKTSAHTRARKSA
jgi:DNA end-binding protein Ku